jgi:hypothetical protein
VNGGLAIRYAYVYCGNNHSRMMKNEVIGRRAVLALDKDVDQLNDTTVKGFARSEETIHRHIQAR